LKLSDEEYEAIIKEIAERVRDIVFMNAERKVKQSLPKEEVEKLLDSGNDIKVISVVHRVEFVVGDLIQILGRLRRGKQNGN